MAPYYEVYDPALVWSSPRLLTSIAFFRSKVKTYETAAALKPGYYICQITIVDEVAGTFAFPRLPLLVR